MIYALSLGEKVEIKRDKKKKKATSSVFSIEKITFRLVYLATTFKVQNLKRTYKTKIPPFHYPTLPPPFGEKKKTTLSWLYFPLCRCQLGLNAGGQSRMGHIALFLPFRPNLNATDYLDSVGW